jgi:hypothetical protein
MAVNILSEKPVAPNVTTTMTKTTKRTPIKLKALTNNVLAIDMKT